MSEKDPSDPPDEEGAVARLPPAGESSSSSPPSASEEDEKRGTSNEGETSKDGGGSSGKRVADQILEEMDEKKQKRRLANRKSARESRDRRLKYTADLEKTVKRLKEQNSGLARQNELLTQELRVQQTENAILSQALAGTGIFSGLPGLGMDSAGGAAGLSALLAAGANPQLSMLGASQGMPPLSPGQVLQGLSAAGHRSLLNPASGPAEQAEFARIQEEEARLRAALLAPQQQLRAEHNQGATDEGESKKEEQKKDEAAS